MTDRFHLHNTTINIIQSRVISTRSRKILEKDNQRRRNGVLTIASNLLQLYNPRHRFHINVQDRYDHGFVCQTTSWTEPRRIRYDHVGECSLLSAVAIHHQAFEELVRCAARWGSHLFRLSSHHEADRVVKLSMWLLWIDWSWISPYSHRAPNMQRCKWRRRRSYVLNFGTLFRWSTACSILWRGRYTLERRGHLLRYQILDSLLERLLSQNQRHILGIAFNIHIWSCLTLSLPAKKTSSSCNSPKWPVH